MAESTGNVELNAVPEEMGHEICSFDLIVTRDAGDELKLWVTLDATHDISLSLK